MKFRARNYLHNLTSLFIQGELFEEGFKFKPYISRLTLHKNKKK